MATYAGRAAGSQAGKQLKTRMLASAFALHTPHGVQDAATAHFPVYPVTIYRLTRESQPNPDAIRAYRAIGGIGVIVVRTRMATEVAAKLPQKKEQRRRQIEAADRQR